MVTITYKESLVSPMKTLVKQRDVAFRHLYNCVCYSNIVYSPRHTVPGWFFESIAYLQEFYKDLQWINGYSEFVRKLAKGQNVIFRS